LPATKNQPAEIAPVLAALPGIPDARIAFDLVRTLDNSLQTLDVSLTTVDTGGALNPLYARARAVAVDMTADDAARVSALRLLNTRPIDPDSEPGVITALTQEWFSLRPAVRNEVLSFLLSKPTRTAILIYALGNSMVPRTDLSSTQTKFLLAHPDASIQVRAVALFQGVTGGPRQMVVNRYLSALQLAGGVEHGREIFAAQCAACHQFAGQGKSFGLPLTDEALADREKVLIKILDPNREPPARHPEMLVITKSGETLTGFVASEGSKNLTLCDDSGQERVLGHSQIASVSKLGFSVMSEGLESVLNQQAMADLLEYLCGQGAKANPQMNADARR
jgi:putative heme-binding domain-containing protein